MRATRNLRQGQSATPDTKDQAPLQTSGAERVKQSKPTVCLSQIPEDFPWRKYSHDPVVRSANVIDTKTAWTVPPPELTHPLVIVLFVHLDTPCHTVQGWIRQIMQAHDLPKTPAADQIDAKRLTTAFATKQTAAPDDVFPVCLEPVMSHLYEYWGACGMRAAVLERLPREQAALARYQTSESINVRMSIERQVDGWATPPPSYWTSGAYITEHHDEPRDLELGKSRLWVENFPFLPVLTVAASGCVRSLETYTCPMFKSRSIQPMLTDQFSRFVCLGSNEPNVWLVLDDLRTPVVAKQGSYIMNQVKNARHYGLSVLVIANAMTATNYYSHPNAISDTFDYAMVDPLLLQRMYQLTVTNAVSSHVQHYEQRLAKRYMPKGFLEALQASNGRPPDYLADDWIPRKTLMVVNRRTNYEGPYVFSWPLVSQES